MTAPGATNTSGLTASAQSVAIDCSPDAGVFVSVHGTYSGLNLTFEASDDLGVTYYSLLAIRLVDGTLEATSGVLADNTSRAWYIPCGALPTVRARASALVSGTATVTLTPSRFAIGAAAGSSGGGGGGAVTVADGANVVEGSTTGAAITSDANGTIQQFLRGLVTLIAARIPALGQALAAASTPVVLPATQITTLTPPAAITGFATSSKQDTGNTSIASVDTKTPALGQAVAAASVPVILPSATVTTLTPPAAITGFATAVKQPALGTAGTASSDVITVQGIASGTPAPVVGVTLQPIVSVAMTTHSSYVSGDFVGTDATPLSFANAVRVSGSTAILQSVVILDKAVQSIAGELWLFNATVIPPSDSAAWSISDADAAKCIAVIPFSTYYASALNSVSIVAPLGIPFQLVGTTLFGAIVTRGAPTYASNDLVVMLGILSD